VVWDREGEEGMRVIQRKGMGWEGKEGKGRKEGRKGGREEGRRKMTSPPPPKKEFLDPPLHNTKVVINSVNDTVCIIYETKNAKICSLFHQPLHTLAFWKRDRVSEARSRFGARRVSEERSCFRRSIFFQKVDRISESRSRFRISIAFWSSSAFGSTSRLERTI
jgi:hypothetical protein